MKRRELAVHAGGLYRCCVQSVAEWIDEDPEAPVPEGQQLTCRYERENPALMIVTGAGVVRRHVYLENPE